MDDLDEWEIRQRAEAALEGREEALEDIARRQAVRVEGRALPAPSRPVYRAREPARARDWTAEQRWVEQIIDQRIGPALAQIRKEENAGIELMATVLGEEVGDLLRAERTKAAERLAASEGATVSLLMELERRIAELEQRAVPAARMLPRVA